MASRITGIVMRLPVQVGVFDWNLPALGGAKLIEVLQAQEDAPRLVVYGNDRSDLPRLSMAAGAAGFVSRAAPVESLLNTCPIMLPCRWSPELYHHIVGLNILALAKGLTNRQLSAELGISTNTVNFHLSNLYDKLSVKNRAQAIAY